LITRQKGKRNLASECLQEMREHLQRPLEEIPLVFLDLETTGLHPQFGHRICEVGMLRCRGRRREGSFQSLVNPRRPISPGATAMHGITDEMVAEAPTFDRIADEVLDFIDNSVIVAHNAPFDLGFLAFQFRSTGISPPGNFAIDTLYLAREHFDFPSNSLPNIAAYLGITVQESHRALQDALTVKRVFDEFSRDFRRDGVSSLEDLLELQGGAVPFPQVPEIALPPEIDEAVKGSGKLKIKYMSRGGVETVRIVEPREVNAYWDSVYLVAFCHLRGEERTFRLDRIVEMTRVE